MADSNTTNYSFVKPEVGASADSWGNKLNANWDSADTELKALEDEKAPLASPALMGTPTAPTATSGTNTTQVATTEFVQTALTTVDLTSVWPVGSVYINAATTTNPATLLGFGTWVAIGAGRVMVGQDTGDASFNTMGETGGSKDAIVVSHTHTGTTGTAGAHIHGLTKLATDEGGYQTSEGYWSRSSSLLATKTNYTDSQGNHNHSFTTNSTGSSGTNANLQPYFVVRMWQRTA